MQEQLKTWQNFKQQAISGEFTLDTDIGSALAARCDELLNSLDGMLKDASDLEFLSGYGGLPSARQLQQKFAQKAVGGAPRRRRQCKSDTDIAHVNLIDFIPSSQTSLGRVSK
ncbi:hypothetical protein CJ469_03510 [Nocardia farcinica]|uniref:hypothetical protein n=1 Tax=Nocardia farcinica TaxID=37329 RepID=UPI000C01EA1C|nr:hypothetical protein [Nocardia farcinica]PFX01395.1 hypothetical protein CJ469_03510 [Nocardia farcinica]PFX02113.1 hypothetical protein CJ468_05963 [Nocardia farcinica]